MLYTKILHTTHKFLYQKVRELVSGKVLCVVGLGEFLRSEFG